MQGIAASRLATTSETQPAKILCIDDDPNVLDAMQLWLNQFDGVELLSAEYGMQGLSIATRHRPAAIITDVRMPQGDGEHIVACLKQLPETQDIPIIVLTGSKDTALQLRMKQLGVRRFLCKPVSWQVLEQALFDVLPQNMIDHPHGPIRLHLR